MTPDELTARARDLVRDVPPGAVETAEGGDLGFGTGPGHKTAEDVESPALERAVAARP
ncbi:MAG TPA: hypothetical protein VN213_04290 [Solirubrobacteraceae bacterium]|nr:hypothetical protein [Solirubrobacteraceae bacterium]